MLKTLCTAWLICLLNAAPNEEHSPPVSSFTQRRASRAATSQADQRELDSAITNCTCSSDPCTDIDLWSCCCFWVFGSRSESQRRGEEGRGGAEVSQPDWARVVGRGRGAEDRQECPRSRDPLSTDRSLTKPYGRYLRGTRTSLRSVRALTDLCGKYDFVFLCSSCFALALHNRAREVFLVCACTLAQS